MDMCPFVSSDPAVRADGWSPERKLRFLNRLAGCGNVRAASAAVGMSRDAAYVLRRRDALFARGWAAALLLARESSIDVLADKATEGIEEEVWYRGELRGTKVRFDARLLLAHIARLDKQIEEADFEVEADAARFDAILAAIAGAEIPEELRDEADPCPMGRDAAVGLAEDDARAAVGAAWVERQPESEAEGEEELDEAAAEARAEAEAEAYAEYERGLETALADARAEAGARWDAWFHEACGVVDSLLAHGGAKAQPAPAEPAAATAPEDAAEPPPSTPRTVSEVSALPLAGTYEWHQAQRALREEGGASGA